MATIIPSDFASLAYSHQHQYEFETLKELDKYLSDDCYVFHGLHWSHERELYNIFGEIDFVIVHKNGAVLIIEQKNGDLEETDHGLVKRYGSNEKSVVEQIHRTRDHILDKYKEKNGAYHQMDLDYMLYCPDFKLVKVNAAGLAKERIVDSVSKKNLSDRIETVLKDVNSRKHTDATLILDFFYQSYDVVVDVGAYKSKDKQVFTRLTNPLLEFVTGLDFSPYRLRVKGTAGSGKSLLVTGMYQKAIQQGKNVALVCYNRPLRDSYYHAVSKDGYVETYHGLCRNLCEQAGFKVDFTESNKSGFWKEVQEKVIELDISYEDKYNLILIDEGQDFKQEWYEILNLVIREDAEIIWVEDPMQNLYSTHEVELIDFVTLHLKKNFRTPVTIADYINSKLDVDAEFVNSLPGLGVNVTQYENEIDQLKLVTHQIKELVKHGFKYEDIVIISMKSLPKTVFNEYDKLQNIELRKFTGNFTSDGEAIYTNGSLLLDTIYRFKGQQAPCVILVNMTLSDQMTDKEKQMLYCAFTRPTVRLEIFCDKEAYSILQDDD
jgi:hypothetical protein